MPFQPSISLVCLRRFRRSLVATTRVEVLLWDCGLDTKDMSLVVFQPEYIVKTATRLGRERRR
jgi:hypothetical protein